MDFYCTNEYAAIRFKCDKRLSNVNIKTVTKNDLSDVTTRIYKTFDGNLCIDCYKECQDNTNFVFFKTFVKYIKGHTYEIKYYFDKVTEPIIFNQIEIDKNLEDSAYIDCVIKDSKKLSYFNTINQNNFNISFKDNENLVFYCKKYECPKALKNEVKQLKKGNLLRVAWDSFVGQYEYVCEACHVKGSAYRDGSNGRVMYKDIGYGGFYYKGQFYGKIPESEWETETFWNVSEYEAVRKKYKNSKSYEKDWPEFEDYWNNQEEWVKKDVMKTNKTDFPAEHRKVALWRASDGTIFTMKPGKSPVIGAYEKVVTKGWCTTVAPSSIECPVCERAYELSCIVGTLTKFQKIKNYLAYEWHIITHPYIIKNRICRKLSLKFKDKRFGSWKNGKRV